MKQVARRVSEGMLAVVVQKTAGELCKTLWHRDQKGEDTAIRAFPRLRVGLPVSKIKNRCLVRSFSTLVALRRWSIGDSLDAVLSSCPS